MRAVSRARGRRANTRRPSPSHAAQPATSHIDAADQKRRILAEPLLPMSARRAFERGSYPGPLEVVERTVAELAARCRMLDRIEQLLGPDVVAAMVARMNAIDAADYRPHAEGGAS